jgi:AraC-like DNA-binding protein
MSVRFKLTTNESLTFNVIGSCLLPFPVLNGLQICHCEDAFGDIHLQEYVTAFFTITNVHITWKKPAAIIADYNYEPGMFTRIMLNNHLHDSLKGAGHIHLKQDQFSLVAGSKWMSLIQAEKTGSYHFVDIAWSTDYIYNVLLKSPELYHEANKVYERLPLRLIGPPHTANNKMKSLLSDVFNVDFRESQSTKQLQHLMRKYLELTLDEASEHESIKKVLRNARDWYLIMDAKTLIDADLNLQLSTPEISLKVGVNEHKLKSLFPRITGFKVDEYRRYKRCIKAGKSIVSNPDEPVKSCLSFVGYANLPNFIRGYRKLCYCSPTELRHDGWDLSGLPNPLQS